MSHEIRTPLTAILGFADTLGRLLGALNPISFQRCFEAWIQSVTPPPEGNQTNQIAIDGNVPRRIRERSPAQPDYPTPIRTEVVQFLSSCPAGVYFTLPLGESSLSEERATAPNPSLANARPSRKREGEMLNRQQLKNCTTSVAGGSCSF